ncbi:alanine racemase [Nocardioidaceae bacterium]|nr:alanine racemase [Nocardioidaceae bacterium]
MPGLDPAYAPGEIVVDLAAVRHNVRLLRQVAGVPLMVVVKADGYGHGMAEVAAAARQAGAEWIGVATLGEAIALREAGDEGPLLAWLIPRHVERSPAVETGIDVAVYSRSELRSTVQAVEAVGVPARIHIKVDTGLTRGGEARRWWRELFEACRSAQDAGLVDVVGLWSHLACADEPGHPANAAQHAAFEEACTLARDVGLEPRVRHLANSAGTLHHPSLRYDLVRCGIAIYGRAPAPAVATSEDLGLRPAMTVRSRLALTKRAEAGDGVSYGHTHVLEEPTTVGLVPVGYADGVPRHGPAPVPMLVADEQRTVLGRVCMDQVVLDVADLHAAPGDEVVLFGDPATGAPSAHDWAVAAGTIDYEILTGMGGRLARRFIDSEEDS